MRASQSSKASKASREEQVLLSGEQVLLLRSVRATALLPCGPPPGPPGGTRDKSNYCGITNHNVQGCYIAFIAEFSSSSSPACPRRPPAETLVFFLLLFPTRPFVNKVLPRHNAEVQHINRRLQVLLDLEVYEAFRGGFRCF